MTKTVLITGAGNRIGKALAIGLAQDGYTVAVHYNRSKEAALSLAKTLGNRAFAIQANLNVPSELETLMERTQSKLDAPLAALINNASTYSPDSAETFSNALYEHHMNVNLKAPLQLSKDFSQNLSNNEKGVIINMIDQRVLKPHPDYFTYALSKYALYEATKTLAQSLAPQIRVCGIGPGPSLQNAHQSADDFSKDVKATLLETGSPPDTILHAARYLLSADAVTGQMICVDGGEHLIF